MTLRRPGQTLSQLTQGGGSGGSSTTVTSATQSQPSSSPSTSDLNKLIQKWAGYVTIFYNPYITRRSFLRALPTFENPWSIARFESVDNMARGHLAELLHSAADLPDIALLVGFAQRQQSWSLAGSSTPMPKVIKSVSFSGSRLGYFDITNTCYFLVRILLTRRSYECYSPLPRSWCKGISKLP